MDTKHFHLSVPARPARPPAPPPARPMLEHMIAHHGVPVQDHRTELRLSQLPTRPELGPRPRSDLPSGYEAGRGHGRISDSSSVARWEGGSQDHKIGGGNSDWSREARWGSEDQKIGGGISDWSSDLELGSLLRREQEQGLLIETGVERIRAGQRSSNLKPLETESEKRKEQIVDAGPPVQEIQKIWLIRKEGLALPGPGSDERWKLVKVAEEYWKEEAAWSAERADKASTNWVASTNQLYQAIGFYAVFQGVLLSACVQTNRLNCTHFKYGPLVFNVLATACTVFGVFNKLRQIHSFWIEKSDFNDQNRFRESLLTDLRKKLDQYPFEKKLAGNSTPSGTYKRKAILFFVEAAVIGFAFANSFLIHSLLCK